MEGKKIFSMTRMANLRMHENTITLFEMKENDESVHALRITNTTTIPIREDMVGTTEKASFQITNIKDLDRLIDELRIFRKKWADDKKPNMDDLFPEDDE